MATELANAQNHRAGLGFVVWRENRYIGRKNKNKGNRMTELAIDTHKFVKQLIESGFTEAQAETLADAQMAFLESRLATKVEMRDLKNELKTEIAELRSEFSELRSDFSKLRSEFSVMLMRSQIATGAAIITILTFIDYLTR
jgi:hypothetical protein